METQQNFLKDSTSFVIIEIPKYKLNLTPKLMPMCMADFKYILQSIDVEWLHC